ncbi:MAG: hypothetical protein VB878_02405, partial [Pirellulaceae bacterium]
MTRWWNKKSVHQTVHAFEFELIMCLQTAHPITPVVIENLSANDNTTLQATDRVVFFKHSQVHGLICTLPASGVSNGHTIYIKNLQTGSSPVRGWGSGGGSGHAI